FLPPSRVPRSRHTSSAIPREGCRMCRRRAGPYPHPCAGLPAVREGLPSCCQTPPCRAVQTNRCPRSLRCGSCPAGGRACLPPPLASPPPARCARLGASCAAPVPVESCHSIPLPGSQPGEGTLPPLVRPPCPATASVAVAADKCPGLPVEREPPLRRNRRTG